MSARLWHYLGQRLVWGRLSPIRRPRLLRLFGRLWPGQVFRAFAPADIARMFVKTVEPWPLGEREQGGQ